MSSLPNPSPSPPAAIAVAEHDALPAGSRFGEFEILRVLGAGGFGIVYLAHDHALDRPVALKEYMPAALAARGRGALVTIRSRAHAEPYASGLRAFLNEARLLARFDHPSLVKVHRVWEDNGTAYMVMPYLAGRTLREWRRAQATPPDEAWIRRTIAPVLDALALLHAQGVVHRDIAPDNIVLPDDAAPVLLDFGAARRAIGEGAQSFTAIVKPSYAPIEQYAEMAALRQGPWSDLYALGAVLHFLLFGAPPAPAVARALQPDADPIESRRVPGASPRFVHAVAWMLAVRPTDRPADVAALRAVLDGDAPLPALTHAALALPQTPAMATALQAGTGAAHEATVPVLHRLRDGSDAVPHGPVATASVPPAFVPAPPGPAIEPVLRAAVPRELLAARRHRRAVGAGLGSAALAAGLLWAFVGVLERPRPAPAASMIVATRPAAVATAPASALPSAPAPALLSAAAPAFPSDPAAVLPSAPEAAPVARSAPVARGTPVAERAAARRAPRPRSGARPRPCSRPCRQAHARPAARITSSPTRCASTANASGRAFAPAPTAAGSSPTSAAARITDGDARRARPDAEPCYRRGVTQRLPREPFATARLLRDAPELAERAADLLRTPGALLNLAPAEAASVVAQMRLVSVGPGVALFREGDAQWLDHLLLLLDGEVSIDTGPGAVAISVVGPGAVLGEMALLDGAPRSANCTTVSAIQAAALSRQGLQALIDHEPRAAVKLLVGLGARTAERLRALGDQLQIYAELHERQRQEIALLRARL